MNLPPPVGTLGASLLIHFAEKVLDDNSIRLVIIGIAAEVFICFANKP